MLFNTLAVASVFVTSALVVAEPVPYQVGKMSLNTAFGLMKRQAGYQPTQTYCGPGTDCASSCGTGYVQCASSDGDLHCYDPTIQQTCCPDGTGNSCDEGYFCTSDASGNTVWTPALLMFFTPLLYSSLETCPGFMYSTIRQEKSSLSLRPFRNIIKEANADSPIIQWCCPDVCLLPVYPRSMLITLGNVSCCLRCCIQLDRCSHL